jgi:hypothetical protein
MSRPSAKAAVRWFVGGGFALIGFGWIALLAVDFIRIELNLISSADIAATYFYALECPTLPIAILLIFAGWFVFRKYARIQSPIPHDAETGSTRNATISDSEKESHDATDTHPEARV